MRKLICIPFVCAIVLFSSKIAAQPDGDFSYPFYAGAIGGYGSTTWSYLIPPPNKQNSSMSLSTPYDVTEGGGVWGLLAGYEIIPFFAVELNYMRYPNAKVMFKKISFYTVRLNGVTNLSTHSDVTSLSAKLMFIIPRSTVRMFSSAGLAAIHRWDNINNHRRGTLTFAMGFNYNFTPHIMGEFGVSFTPGYGVAEIEPAQDYVTFLYSGTLRLAYRF